jgi:hypothetical protein
MSNITITLSKEEIERFGSEYDRDAVKLYYLCNRSVECNWVKTDLSGRKVNCKKCKRLMKK